MIVQKLGAAGLANNRPVKPMRHNGTGYHGAFVRSPKLTPPGGASWSKSPSATTSPAPSSSIARSAKSSHEEQIYRIDHYLGKETVQNILVFRFANGIWEPIWSRRYVDSVQITVGREPWVEDRASYYDNAGALTRYAPEPHDAASCTRRDGAAHPPSTPNPSATKKPKCSAPSSRSPRRGRPQHHPRPVRPRPILGKPVLGYHQEQASRSFRHRDIRGRRASSSTTGAGPACPSTCGTASAYPSASPRSPSSSGPRPSPCSRHTSADELQPNVLVLHIQPDEGISIKFESKAAGPGNPPSLCGYELQLWRFFRIEIADAYERLLWDAMIGDSTLFTRRDEVELMWMITTSILEGWKRVPPPTFPNYRAGKLGSKRSRRIYRPRWSPVAATYNSPSILPEAPAPWTNTQPMSHRKNPFTYQDTTPLR